MMEIRRIPRIFIVLWRLTTVVYVAEHCEDVRTGTFSNKYLSGSGFTTLSPFGYQQCISLCMVSRECQSINYDLRHHDCELNTETTQTATSLTDKNGNVFKDMNDTSFSTPPPGNCQKTTCQEYYTCVELSNGNVICIEPVPEIKTTTTTTTATTTTTTTPTTTTPTATTAGTMTCVAPYTENLSTGLCLYYGTGYSWFTAINGCPYPGRLFVADTTDKVTAVYSLCPSSTNCWLGAEYTNGDFYWSTGDVVTGEQRGTGDCLRAKDNVLKGGTCSTAVSYICEQVPT